MLSYGAMAGDTEVTSLSSLTGERVSPLIVIPNGIPVGDGILANSIYVRIWFNVGKILIHISLNLSFL